MYVTPAYRCYGLPDELSDEHKRGRQGQERFHKDEFPHTHFTLKLEEARRRVWHPPNAQIGRLN